jgi:hypothetical protein
MANEVISTIKFFGNNAVTQLREEIIKRFSDDMKATGKEYDLSAVKRILFGLKEDDDFDTYGLVGSKWAHPEDSGDLSFRSAWTSVNELQDHITKHAAKLDANVVTLMTYMDEVPLFVGARFSVCNRGKVYSYECQEDMSGWLFVLTEEEAREAVEENEETAAYEHVALHDDVDSYLKSCETRALAKLIEDFPRTSTLKAK